MEQKFDIGLNSKMNEFTKKFGITRSNDNDTIIFEQFANYIVSSNFWGEEIDNLNLISTNKARGIDGIVIIVNDKIIAEEADLTILGPTEQIKIKIAFIQSTTSGSFDERKLAAFTDEVVKFLCTEIDIEPFSTIYRKLLDETDSFIDRIEETPHISLYFLSAKTSHQITSQIIEQERRKIENRKDIENKCLLKDLLVYQKDEIKSQYDKIAKLHTTQLKFEKSVELSQVENVDFSLLATIKFTELKKLILTKDEILKERLFVENVRNFIGNTPVNIDIKKTLDNITNRAYFPFLNNGLVIICDKIEKHPVKPNEFILTFPRIINGCQTTNILYKKYKEHPNDLNDVEVVAKIVSTKNNELKKSIIYAANNQNSIDKDLQSLNEFHEKIETCFTGMYNNAFKLFFERLRGQYADVVPPYCKLNIETLARIYISVFLRRPHEMKGYALSVIEQFQKEGKIFNSSVSEATYYYCGVLWFWFNHFLTNNIISLKSKTMDMHILMACDISLSKEKKTIEEKILFLSEANNAKILFENVVGKLNSKEYLFGRRGFYANKYTQALIKDINNDAI